MARMLIDMVGLKALIDASGVERLFAELSREQRRELERLLRKTSPAQEEQEDAPS